MPDFSRTELRRCKMTHLMLPPEAFRCGPANANRSVLGVAFFNVSARSVNGRYSKSRANHYPRNSHHRKGVRMLDSWVDDPTAFGLWILMNIGLPPTPSHSLDRIDNTGGYFPGNLRWATPYEQANNRDVVTRRSDF